MYRGQSQAYWRLKFHDICRNLYIMERRGRIFHDIRKSSHIMEWELEIFHGIGKNSHIMEGELKIFHGIVKNSHIMEGECQNIPWDMEKILYHGTRRQNIP